MWVEPIGLDITLVLQRYKTMPIKVKCTDLQAHLSLLFKRLLAVLNMTGINNTP